jgi:hypothetical protein
MKILNIIAVLLLIFNFPAHAEEKLKENNFTAGQSVIFDMESEKSAPAPQEAAEALSRMNIPEEAEVTVVQDQHAGNYISPTVQNFSRLYWNKDALSLSSDTAIDNFLLINECAMYERFFEDDFEWLRVREAARQMIEDKKDGFSSKFKMVIPIDLGRYDMQRKGFPLINNTAFLDLRRVEIGGNFGGADICGNNRIIEGYPRNAILILSKPFSYSFVELDEHVAQALIIKQKYEPAERPKELKNEIFNRLAFARMRISFDKYQGETRGVDNQPRAIMFGRLDGIDIFEDAREKNLLTSIDLK